MKEIKTSPRQLLDFDRLTFLAGAGCSVDPPSCQPAGNGMMKAIVQFACPASQVEKILALDQLRFEALVEIIRDSIDPELRVIDYFAQCDRPNPQHFFLAEMLRQGHFVVTTNFDSLIEQALIQSGVARENIHPVITRLDFFRFNDPSRLFADGHLLVLKAHGSTHNFVTNENTRASLIATIQAFGSYREGLNIFQMEPFKEPLLNELFDDRTIVVLGYSGSDDFDIVPTLIKLPNLRNVVWINHVQDAADARIFEVTDDDLTAALTGEKVQQILVELKRRGSSTHVYRVDINTSRFTLGLVDTSQVSHDENFSLEPATWLEERLASPPEIMRHVIAYKIYHGQRELTDALLQCMAVLKIAEQRKDYETMAIFLNNMGAIYQAQQDEHQAIKAFKESIDIFEQMDRPQKIVKIRANLAAFYHSKKRYEEALHEYELLVPAFETETAPVSKGLFFSNFGTLLVEEGRVEEGLYNLTRALEIFDEVGGLEQKGITLSSIASAHAQQGNYDEADRYWNTAVDLQKQLSDREAEANTIWTMALSLRERGDVEGSLNKLLDGFHIVRELPWAKKASDYLAAIADTFVELERYTEALDYLEPFPHFLMKRRDYGAALDAYQKMMPILLKSGDTEKRLDAYHNMAMAYQGTGRPREASDCYEKMLPILREADDFDGLFVIYNNIGGCHLGLGNYEEAHGWFRKSLHIQAKTTSSSPEPVLLMNIGIAALKLHRLDEAVERLDQARAAFVARNELSGEYFQSTTSHLEFAKEMMKERAEGKDTVKSINSLTLRPIDTGVPDDVEMARSLVKDGQAHMAQGNFDEAEECYQKAHTLFFKLGASEDLAATRRHLGEVYFSREEYEKAILQFVGAQADFERLGQYEDQFQTCHALGVTHERLERLADAAAAYKKAYWAADKTKNDHLKEHAFPFLLKKLTDLHHVIGDPTEAAEWVNLAANQAVESGQVDAAARYFRYLIELYERLGEREKLGYAYNNMGNAMRLMEKYQEALQSYELAIRCFEELGDQKLVEFSRDMIDQVKARMP